MDIPARHCEQCGTLLVAAHIEGRMRECCPACGFVVYRNPAPVVLTVIEHEKSLVLIRRSFAPLAGYWAPPGGYVESGESVSQGARREAREECGLEIELDELLGVHSQHDVGVLIVAFRAHSVGGELHAGDDAAEVGVFAPWQAPRQSAPTAGSPTERWFFGVIDALTEHWQPRKVRTCSDEPASASRAARANGIPTSHGMKPHALS